MTGRARAAALCALLAVACHGGEDQPPPDPAPTYYQSKTPYRPQQDAATYEAPPPGFTAVYTQLVARHGSRGLAGMKSDLIVHNMWERAAQEGALTELGRKLGPDVLAIMRANALLGYGVPGITHPGYGNESRVGIREHTELAQRLLARRSDLFAATSRKIVVVSSGVDRAVDSAGFFVASLVAARPTLAPLVTYPPAPAGYPEGHPQHQPDGTNRFLLYFHKLVPATDLVTTATDPFYRTYQDSRTYQAYFEDPELLAKENAIATDPAARVQGRALLERLFAKSFVDRIDSGALTFANTGTMTFTSDDGKFTSTLTGDGKATLASLSDAGSYLWDLYSVAPGLILDGAPDMRAYFTPEEAQYFAYVADAYEFYDKGPSIAEKGDITYRIARILQDDFFAEVDAIARGDLAHAAKLRFAHAEIIMPFAAKLGLAGASEPSPLSTLYTYADNPWRGERVSPMAANVQWDVFRDAGGNLLVRMLYNEKETDFKPACESAKFAPGSRFYVYAKLAACYGYKPA